MRKFCQDKVLAAPESPFSLSTSEWDDVEKLLGILTPMKITTDIFQKQQFTYSDFFYQMFKLRFHLQPFAEISFTKHILAALVEREKDLLRGNALLGSLALDPRFNVLLTEDQIKLAKEHLMILNEYVQKNLDGNKKKQNCSESANETLLENSPDTSIPQPELSVDGNYVSSYYFLYAYIQKNINQS